MYEEFKSSCTACKKIFDNYSTLNTHLQKCIYYEEWLKNYIPDATFVCPICEMKFVTTEYLSIHIINCKNKNIT